MPCLPFYAVMHATNHFLMGKRKSVLGAAIYTKALLRLVTDDIASFHVLFSCPLNIWAPVMAQ